ncbi:MAG: hypothetical protein ACOY9Y_05520 [Bacillota bacterium]
MGIICPLCNGLESLREVCPECGFNCLDQGPVSGFADPYSPYEEAELLSADGAHPDRRCIHLVSCPRCGWDCRLPVGLVGV